MSVGHAPSRSLTPPGLPRELRARARMRSLREELGRIRDAHTQGLLHFELGALREHGLGERTAAIEHYRKAHDYGCAQPALLALARVYLDADQAPEAAEALMALAQSGVADPERAAALCEVAI